MNDFIFRHITFRLIYIPTMIPPFYTWYYYHNDKLGYWKYWWPTWLALIIVLIMIETLNFKFNKE